MVTIQPLISEFTLVGKLEDLVISPKGRVKYLYLSTFEKDYVIKVAKEQKNILSRHLKQGCRLKVSGMRKCKPHELEAEYKAYVIEFLAETLKSELAGSSKSKSKILICQSSSCCKQGGKAVYEQLRRELHVQGIAEQVEIKITGCLKQCKQGPNLIISGKDRYSRVKPQQVSALVQQHVQQHLV